MRMTLPKPIAEKLVGLTKKDFRVDTFKASGHGGQKVDKTDSAVRITHIDTNISAESSETRSQKKNKSAAFIKLVNKLIAYYTSKMFNKDGKDSIQFGNKIRTYNEPRNEVKDHRTNKRARYTDVLDGDLDGLIDEVLKNNG